MHNKKRAVNEDTAATVASAPERAGKAIPNQDASSIVALGFAHTVHIRDRHISAFPIWHRIEEKFQLGES